MLAAAWGTGRGRWGVFFPDWTHLWAWTPSCVGCSVLLGVSHCGVLFTATRTGFPLGTARLTWSLVKRF